MKRTRRNNIKVYIYGMFTLQLVYGHQSRIIYYQYESCTISINNIKIYWGLLVKRQDSLEILWPVAIELVHETDQLFFKIKQDLL